mmetsp:Transcript_21649/g.47062  ORF Transcript_21649/g.47062 Transcript_21649/m.47062 type:complete len:118 (-) Transcript_21649:42-395(-)
MARTWMEDVFHHAETRSSNTIIEEDEIISVNDDEYNISYASAISYYEDRSKKGQLTFSATCSLLVVMLLCCITYNVSKKVHCFIGKGMKRKTSEENLHYLDDRDHIVLEKMVTSDAH